MKQQQLAWYLRVVYGILVLAALVGTFVYPYHVLMKTNDLPNIEAMQDKQKDSEEKILYDVEKLPKGTYCTARSNDFDGVPFYQKPGDSQSFCLLPEGKYVSLVDNAVVDGRDWGQVSYCGLDGWLPMKHLTYLSETLVSIEKGSVVYINADTEFGIDAYAEPSSNGEVVKEGLRYGEEFVVEELKDGWGLVSRQDEIGWINMYHVGSYGKEDVNFWRVTLFGTAEGLNLRSEPNAEGKRLVKIPDKEVLSIHTYQDGWGAVEYDGQEGWVMLRYMTPCTQ